MSEGRKAFAARLAGIEAGAECDRLAPQVSALADGEASAEDMAVLRTHLRTCLVCRARLREYRAAPARVAAMTPPVAAGGLLAAAREALQASSARISERAAALAVRWHHATELALAHKGAAVVASAALLGGGGVGTIATVAGANRRTPRRRRTPPRMTVATETNGPPHRRVLSSRPAHLPHPRTARDRNGRPRHPSTPRAAPAAASSRPSLPTPRYRTGPNLWSIRAKRDVL